MKVSIGQAGIRLLDEEYSSTTEYLVSQAVRDQYGNWWVSKKGTKDNPNKGHALPTITNGKQTASDWWTLMVNMQDVVNATNAAITAKNQANTAKNAANTAANLANQKAAYADAIGQNPPKIGEDGFWYFYDPTQEKYLKTEYVSKGGIEFPTFSIDYSSMILQVENDNDTAHKFSIDDETGELCINL